MVVGILMIFCLLAAIGTGAPAFAQTASGASAAAPAAPLTDPNLAPARIQEFQNGIPVGTKITMANWEQYKSFMTDGLVELFEGKNFWKMPPDVEMNIGPTRIFPLPAGYPEATEKYGGQTEMVKLPDGHYDLKNYVAGEPFPVPAATDPDRGWKILADSWYGPVPRIAAGTPETGLASLCALDRFGSANCLKTAYVYRMLSHIYSPGYPVTEPNAGGAWYSEWAMLEAPEQSKYLANLTIFWQDNQKQEDDFAFIPALRRTLRLSASARCSPIFGTDYTRDDARGGFNGGIAQFQATWLRDQKILALSHITTAVGTFPEQYDMPLGFAKPSWGPWEVRDTYVIDIRRIPSEARGYCYGKRINYIDKVFMHEDWSELYDANMKLWKVLQLGAAPKIVNGVETSVIGSFWAGMWDLQTSHATLAFTADGPGRDIVIDEAVPKEFEDIQRYCTPAGMMMILR
ncbi:MAG: DUF1329 domain-containing protein [Candidatus Binataceae bacterium]